MFFISLLWQIFENHQKEAEYYLFNQLKINENNKDKKNVFFLESIEKSELQLTDESENQKLIKDLIYFFNLGSRKKHEHKLKNFEEFKQRLKVKLFY